MWISLFQYDSVSEVFADTQAQEENPPGDRDTDLLVERARWGLLPGSRGVRRSPHEKLACFAVQEVRQFLRRGELRNELLLQLRAMADPGPNVRRHQCQDERCESEHDNQYKRFLHRAISFSEIPLS
jgi:hypothetical protein